MVPVIRGRWRKITAGAIAMAALAAMAARSHAASDPLAELKAGAAALDAQRYSSAIQTLEPLRKKLPKLADYVAWFLASAEVESQQYTAATKTLEIVWKQTPPSPLGARSVLLAARAYGLDGDNKAAVDILRKNYATLPQPQGDLALASAFAASGDQVSAAVYDQRVYYRFPMSAEAAQADADLAKLRSELGDTYPPAMPDAMLGRALKLLDAGSSLRARKELEAIIPQLGGAERDLARVRIGVADFNRKETLPAQKYLASLEVSSPEADAERLSYLVLAERRLKNQDAVHATLDKLARLYPASNWRLQAILADANSHLVENQLDVYEPLYRACYESFPGAPEAAACHWKVAWGHYFRRNPDAAEMLRAHLRLFPGSGDAPAALYFLGRLSEAAGDAAGARTWFGEIVREYPNYYYTVVAREQLATLGAGPVSSAVSDFLRGVKFPPRARTLSFVPNPTTTLRIERSRMLSLAGLDDWAEVELRYGAQTEDQPHILALDLAALASRRAGPDQAMRYIKRYAGGYLYMPLDSAPKEFWRYAFPMPYRDELEKFSKHNGMDPFLVAALIRQESEFNPKAVSHQNARGLTQILPSTGRELSRRLKLRPYTTARLFQPAVNLELGTYYLKTMADTLGGHYEAALAAYNAGLSRAHSWLSWGNFREPAEFIETVPFSETRSYIQTVLRNADVYRRLYGGSEADATVAARK
ncbi:MAG TPA: transglycosylase SLT domain-containing protein [Bryobacteraceae bacterium]|nr:transglycosylase SLT domain-containing protein [Bryobacteraceae bacterium]